MPTFNLRRCNYVHLSDYLVIVFDNVHNVATVAAQRAVTAAFNVMNKLNVSSICLNLTVFWYCKDEVHFVVSNGATNLIN